MTAPGSIERRREWSLAMSLIADTALATAYTVVSIGSGSLAMLAETVRGATLTLLGWSVFVLMRRVHRGRLHSYEYGTGKLEQFANFMMGSLLLLGAIWVAGKTAMNFNTPPSAGGPWMAAASALTAINLLINLAAFAALWRAGRDGTSLIMRGQIRSRLGKLGASFVMLLAVGVATALPGTQAAWVANLLGAGFVVAVMLSIGIGLLRETLPDLLDRALDESRQASINVQLAHHFDRYESLEQVRSRQSGTRLYVEIVLGFSPDRGFGEVADVCRGMEGELEALIPGAFVTVLPQASVAPTG